MYTFKILVTRLNNIEINCFRYSLYCINNKYFYLLFTMLNKSTKITKSSKHARIAIINKEKCKPSKCNFECGLICPSNRQGKECIKLVDIEDMGSQAPKKIANINEDFCIGCGMCTKEPQNGGCPFGAVMIVNVPTEIEKDIIHRYGPNGFRLYKMPILKPGVILGLIGQNGIGKTSIVNILSGKLKPNFEKSFDQPIPDKDIINMFKGNEMHKYMTKLYSNQLKINIKPQLVDSLIPFLKSKKLDPTVKDYLSRRSDYLENDPWYLNVINTLEINIFLDFKVLTLSGGELQRLICASTLLSKSNVYIFDEPTNYLDVSQRLKLSHLIKELITPDTYVIVIEHDLAILDYVSDEVSILYGHPNAYGIVSRPMGTAVAINSYFEGFIQSENMRFRTTEFDCFSINSSESTNFKTNSNVSNYEGDIVIYDKYELTISGGSFPTDGSISVIMGKNGTGKTTFVNKIANQLKSNNSVSHKPQYLSITEFILPNGTYPTVNDFLLNSIRDNYVNPLFLTDVVRPLNIDSIKDIPLNELSGGNLQKIWIIYSLGQNANIYLLDEPSANLDVEARINVAKVIKKFAMHNRKVVFVVEHDMMINIALGNEINTQSIIIDIKEIDDQNNKKCIAESPSDFNLGINKFLEILNITFHTQTKSKNGRPRINKPGSVKDREQKLSKKFYD